MENPGGVMSFQLMHHQKDAINFALSNDGIAAFYHDIGCGKTLSALSTFRRLRNLDPTLKLLVICPLSLIYGAWTREIEKFTSYNWCDLHDKKEPRRFNPGTVDIWLVNFEHLISQSGFTHVLNIVHNFTYLPWMCVIDESSKMKNYKAKTVQRILLLKKYFKHRIVMSGTPAPNVEWEYWPQMFFLNDSILGNNFYKFKNTHFALRRGNQSLAPGVIMNAATIRKMHEQGYKYEIIPEKKVQMFDRMKPWCHMVKAENCIDLPEEIDEFRTVEMTDLQKNIYKQMEKQYIAELPPGGSFTVANVVLTKLMKLRQITSGFAIDDKKHAVPIVEKNPKIEALLDIVEECRDKQMLIWGNFHWEMEQIIKTLATIGGVSRLYGKINYNIRNEELDKFLNGKNRFLVANAHSAGHGLTLTNCHIAVFFSLDYSMEGYTQARGRIYRKGQKNNCIYFHLLAKDSIDEDVLRIVQKKETAQEFAARYLVK